MIDIVVQDEAVQVQRTIRDAMDAIGYLPRPDGVANALVDDERARVVATLEAAIRTLKRSSPSASS